MSQSDSPEGGRTRSDGGRRATRRIGQRRYGAPSNDSYVRRYEPHTGRSITLQRLVPAWLPTTNVEWSRSSAPVRTTTVIVSIVYATRKRNKWSNNFDEEPHRRGRIFLRGTMWYGRPVCRIWAGCCTPVGCRSRVDAVIDFLVHTPIDSKGFQLAGQPRKLPLFVIGCVAQW